MNTQSKSMAAPTNHKSLLTTGKRPKRGKHCHSVLKRRNYFFTLFAWCLLQVSIVFTLIILARILITREFHHLTTLFIAIGVSLLFQIAYLITRRTCRCPLCKGHQLRPGKSQKHKKAFRIKPFSHAYTSMITMYSAGAIRCLHCGTPFDIYKKIPIKKAIKSR